MKIRILFLGLLFLIGCSKITPRKPVNQKPSTTIYSNTIKQAKALYKIEENLILEYIQKDSLHTYMQSSSGFWYAYNAKIENESIKPKKGDEVTISYDISDLNDSIIYSKEVLGKKTYKVDQEDFITGIQKGIKLMKIGETITFVIPSYNAFGIAGDGDKIGVNQSIKSKVTLINIKQQ